MTAVFVPSQITGFTKFV